MVEGRGECPPGTHIAYTHMRSIHDAVKFERTLDPQSFTTDTNGNSADTKGYNDAELVIAAGALEASGASQQFTVTVQDSSDDSTFADATDADGNIIRKVLNKDSDSNSVTATRIGQLGQLDRHLRAKIEVASNTTATIGATIALGRAFDEPVGN